MKIKELKNRPDINQHKKLYATYTQFDKLIRVLSTKQLPTETISSVNEEVDFVNFRLEIGEGVEKKNKICAKSYH